MEMREIASWVGLALRTLVSLGVIGVALGVVRPHLPRSGWLLAATAAFGVLATCCSSALWRGTSALESYDTAEAAYTGLAVLDLLQVLVSGALLVAVIAMLAREGKRGPSQP